MLPQIPTDNFYKFLSLTSLVLFLFFIFAPVYYSNLLQIKIYELESELDTTNKKVELASSFEKSANSLLETRLVIINSHTDELNSLTERINKLKLSEDFDYDKAKVLKKEYVSLTSKNEEHISLLNKQLEFSIKISDRKMKAIELFHNGKAKVKVLALYESNLKKIDDYQLFGSLFFGILSLIGFVLWAIWQVKSDRNTLIN